MTEVIRALCRSSLVFIKCSGVSLCVLLCRGALPTDSPLRQSKGFLPTRPGELRLYRNSARVWLM